MKRVVVLLFAALIGISTGLSCTDDRAPTDPEAAGGAASAGSGGVGDARPAGHGGDTAQATGGGAGSREDRHAGAAGVSSVGGMAGGPEQHADAGVGRDAASTADARVTADAATDPRARRWVFLLIGQSNMAGQAPCAASDAVAPARVFKLASNHKWVPGYESFNIAPFLPEDGAACAPGAPFLGPGRAFATSLLSKISDAGVEIDVINAAVRGSAIESWDPAGADNNYSAMLPYLADGLRTGVLMGVLWHQGESNGATPSADYAAKLEAIVKALRAKSERPELPFVLGEIGTTGAANNVNSALRSLAQRDAHVVVTSSSGLQTQSDGVHYDAASQREYGRRYAEAWWTLQGR